MDEYTVLNALIPLLSAVPKISADLAEALKLHWGKDHVQQALTGLDTLHKIVTDIAIANAQAAAASPVPMQLQDVTVSATGTVGNTDAAVTSGGNSE